MAAAFASAAIPDSETTIATNGRRAALRFSQEQFYDMFMQCFEPLLATVAASNRNSNRGVDKEKTQ